MIVREFINLIGFRVNESQFRKTEARVNAFQGRLQRFGTQATLFLTAPFIALNIWMGKTMSDFEQLDVAFETMLGSAEKADKLVKDMLQFAAKTPFEVKEIGGVAKQLLAVGIEGDKVLDTLKSLGDVAAGLSVPVSRLALNFGQIKTQGKLTGRELRDFAVAGVPLTAELAKMLGVSEKAISSMVSKGSIGFSQVDQAFKNMTSSGGRFANLMIKQSATLGGMWSNFKDLITLTVREYSKDLLPMFKGIINFGIKFLDFFKNKLSSTMKKTIFIIGGLVAVIGPLTLAFALLIKVGLIVQGTLLAISGAAAAANMSTSLFLLKFALMGVAVIATILLALALFEDISIFLKGGDSLIGKLINKLNALNEKLKSIGIFTLDRIKETLKSINAMFDNFIEVIVGVFMGKWKFALDSLKSMFFNAFKSILNMGLTLIQPLIDAFKKIPGIENIGNIASKGAGVLKQVGANAAIGLTTQTAPGMSPSFNTNINLTLPNNPTPEQMEAVKSDVLSAASGVIKIAARDLATAMPELE